MSHSPIDQWIRHDAEVTDLLAKEWERQTTTLQLIASENYASPAVMAATGLLYLDPQARDWHAAQRTTASPLNTLGE